MEIYGESPQRAGKYRVLILAWEVPEMQRVECMVLRLVLLSRDAGWSWFESICLGSWQRMCLPTEKQIALCLSDKCPSAYLLSSPPSCCQCSNSWRMELTPVLRTTKAGQPCTSPPAMATITLVSGEGEFCLPASLWQRF